MSCRGLDDGKRTVGNDVGRIVGFILLDYDGGEISPWRCTSRGSLAAFIDSEYRLFVKNFISV